MEKQEIEIIELQKKEIENIFNSTSDNFEVTYPTQNTAIGLWQRGKCEYVRFEIRLGFNFLAKEIFENPADGWEYEFNQLKKFSKSVIERY